MKTRKEKGWLIIIIALLVVSPLLIRKIFNISEALIIEGKSAHSANAIVIRKEHVQFDEKNHTYLNEDGFPIEMRPGEEQWRLYYRINDFGGVEKAIKIKLLKIEEERGLPDKPRFTIVSKNQYDYIQEGGELVVSWRWYEGNQIQIISAGKPVTIYSKN